MDSHQYQFIIDLEVSNVEAFEEQLRNWLQDQDAIVFEIGCLPIQMEDDEPNDGYDPAEGLIDKHVDIPQDVKDTPSIQMYLAQLCTAVQHDGKLDDRMERYMKVNGIRHILGHYGQGFQSITFTGSRYALYCFIRRFWNSDPKAVDRIQPLPQL